MECFKELGIIEPILMSIKEEKFEKPSLIQQKAIPLVVAGRDVIAGASTGSGKTLAFGVGIIQRTEKGKGIQALVVTPTRELAEQITNALIKFSKYKPLSIIPVYGGVAIGPQEFKLRTADVVVGTPGRILDHLSRRTIDLSKVKTLVLDEADRMLDMGFIDDVTNIIKRCPTQRQTLLCSATVTTSLYKLAEGYMKNPAKVAAEAYVDPKKLKQVYYNTGKLKFSLLAHLLKQKRNGLAMVFCNSRQSVDFVIENLKIVGISAQAIHGGFSQDKRNQAIERFHSQKMDVLICTDVAARGLDIKGVTQIYNYDTPNESKQYIHRIGRTARAGNDGIAINLIAEQDHDNFSRVLRDFDVSIKLEEMPYVRRIMTRRITPVRGFGNNFRRFGDRNNSSFRKRY